MAERNKMGKEGESVAQSFLKKKGYTILETNWRWHHFELDIIAVDEDWLVIVEVKTRSDNFLLSPEDAVDRRKTRRIALAADAYIRENQISLPVRFDIVTLIKHEEGFRIDHLDDAFLVPFK